jgi:DNA-binding transcriptional regulator YdaS (Cro superfamily)
MRQELNPLEALRASVARLGGQSPLARVCGVGQPAVWKWLQSAKRLPAQHVLAVEAATGVSRHLLRPDIYPREIDRALAPSEVGEPFYECGPILSVRAQAGNGNRGGVLANGGAA